MKTPITNLSRIIKHKNQSEVANASTIEQQSSRTEVMDTINSTMAGTVTRVLTTDEDLHNPKTIKKAIGADKVIPDVSMNPEFPGIEIAGIKSQVDKGELSESALCKSGGLL
ncbi:hypothetical protein V6N13_060018 [Hibiscus sabdariffa]|uniref:Uncharacterized protein n=1 Tax=Hibiscus sabdariffa TaxID=183260 RepID=A0ABR2GBD4_9ROSI